MRLDALLRRSLIPKGYRPTSPADIDRLLSTIDPVIIDEPAMQRMLRKINGEEPMFPERPATAMPEVALTEEERELVALHRSGNTPLPPDLAAKIKALEERASKDVDDDQEETDV